MEFPLLKFWGGGEKRGVIDFFLFPMCSHQVLNEFQACSSSSQCAQQHVPNSTSLCPTCLAQYSPLGTYICGQNFGT
jgi:hypothetical protein